MAVPKWFIAVVVSCFLLILIVPLTVNAVYGPEFISGKDYNFHSNLVDIFCLAVIITFFLLIFHQPLVSGYHPAYLAVALVTQLTLDIGKVAASLSSSMSSNGTFIFLCLWIVIFSSVPLLAALYVNLQNARANVAAGNPKYDRLLTSSGKNGSTRQIDINASKSTTIIKDEENQGLLDGQEDKDNQTPFIYSTGLTSAQAEELLHKYGPNVLPEKKVPKWYIFVSQLWQPMPIMIWIAAIIEAAIQNWLDMGILLFIQFANASIAFYEITKAGDAVDALKKSLQPKATVKRDGKWQEISATIVVPGDLVLLASGSAIPADCRVNKGQIDVDQAALTGESLPVAMHPGDSCKMGSTVVRGETEGTVEFTGIDTFFGKTAALLGGSNEISNMQKMLVSIVINLVILSTVLCSIVLGYVSTIVPFGEALSFVVVLMVASIPMAIEIVTTTTLALGSKELSKHGAIVTRLAAIEDMAGMAILCSDKTGTLTLNKMEIQEYTPIYSPGETQYTLLRYAAMAAKWHEPPRDALDKLTLGAVDLASLDVMEQLDYMPFDPVVKRTEGSVKDKKTGKQYKTTKGAPHVLLKLVKEGNGVSQEIIDQCNKDVNELGERGIRAIAVAKTDDNGIWRLLGLLTFLDPPRPDSKKTIETAREYGVAVKMITGDHLLIAKETSRTLGLGLAIRDAEGLPMLNPQTKEKPEHLSRDYGDICLAADGFAQVFPEHKYLIVECLRELHYKVGMTGDGVNDAPALKRADVGVAVEGATDAAKAAADIVLTRPGLSTIVDGILISRCIWVRIRSFLTYRIAATLQLVTFFFIAVFAYRPDQYMPSDWETRSDFPDDEKWPPFFHMPVLMLMLITLLNDGTLITIGYDIAIPTQTPPKWNLPFLFSMAAVQSGVAMISSLVLLDILLSSWEMDSLLQLLGVGGFSYGKITAAVYLKVSVSDFLTLFSARAGGEWFWKVKPAAVLFCGAMVALTSSTLISMFWSPSSPDKIPTEGLCTSEPYILVFYVWLWSLIWWFVEDAAKVMCRYYVHKYNIFNINDTGVMVMTPGALDAKRLIEQAKPHAHGHH
jgi:H+-transporting ATPase